MANINKRGTRWLARYRDDTGREHAQRFDCKVDAQRWIDEATTALVTGQYVDPRAGRETFAEFYGAWSQRQVWAPNTRRAMGLAARSVPFADSPLRSLRRSNIEQWVKEMHSRGLAAGAIQTRFNNVKAVLRAAARDRVIAADPSDGVTLPRRRRSQAAMTLPTDAQVRALLDAAEPKFEAFIALAAFAGLRLGEIAGPQVGDIDFLRRTLAVSRQVQQEDGGGVEIRPPKYGSERGVYLPDGLVQLLARHVEQHRPGTHPARWLFEGAPGDPPHQNTVGYWWRKAQATTGITGMKMHDLSTTSPRV